MPLVFDKQNLTVMDVQHPKDVPGIVLYCPWNSYHMSCDVISSYVFLNGSEMFREIDHDLRPATHATHGDEVSFPKAPVALVEPHGGKGLDLLLRR